MIMGKGAIRMKDIISAIVVCVCVHESVCVCADAAGR